MTRRITYIVNARIPTERANGVQIMHTCEAFAQAGADVELIVPRRLNALRADPYDYYGIERLFKIKRLPTIDLIAFGTIGFLIQEKTFALSAWVYLFLCQVKDYAEKSKIKNKKTTTPDISSTGAHTVESMGNDTRIVYIRGEAVFNMLTYFRHTFPLFLESHMKPKNFPRWLPIFKLATGIVVITQYYTKELLDAGLSRVVCAPDGVVIENFDRKITKSEARKKLDIPTDKKIILYNGNLYSWKGTDTLAEAAALLPTHYCVLFVGGSLEDIEPFKARHKGNDRIKLLGHKPYTQIPDYLKAADVLMLPNTKKEDVSRWYTSPIKLFEYMASNRPIIVSDLPSMRDILDEQMALFVEPDNPKAFAEAIIKVVNHEQQAEKLAYNARQKVNNYSWAKRAEHILLFLESSSKSNFTR